MASQRDSLTHAECASADMVLLSSPDLLARGRLAAAQAVRADLVTETLKDLLALVVPGANRLLACPGSVRQKRAMSRPR